MKKIGFSEQLAGRRFAFLLALLLTTMLLYSLVGNGTPLRIALYVIFTLSMISALDEMRAQRVIFFLGLASGIIGQTLSIYGEVSQSTAVTIVGHSARFFFLGIVIFAILRTILNTEKVEIDAIFGASCCYMLIGYAFSDIYRIMESLHPDTFSGISHADKSWVPRFGDMPRDAEIVYFSLITLTTVGYGDIVPQSPPARFVAALEGIVGQLFLAVIVARLVALEISARLKRD